MERAVVHGVHVSSTAAKITVTGVPDNAGATAAVFRALAEQGVGPGLVSQHPAGPPPGRTIAFTVARSAAAVALATLRTASTRIGFHQVHLDDEVAVLTLTGAGLRSDSAAPAMFCEVLARAGVQMEIVSVESRRISVVCGEHELPAAVAALCEVFEVDAPHRGALRRPVAKVTAPRAW